MNSQRPSWRRLPIEATCSRVTSGGTPLRSNLRFYDGGLIRWVKTGELKDWYIEETEEEITEEAIQESSAKLLPRETVLMAMYGDGRTITSLGILRHESACNQACCAMIANPAVCSPLFLFYSLKAQRHALIKLAYGGAQRNLNAKTIRQFDIAVPPTPIQDRITAILSAYDDLIENNTRRIKILEKMAQMLYREWFVNFRFPGDEKVRMVESELGPIPEGWAVERLETVVEEFIDYRGKTPTKLGGDWSESGILALSALNVKQGRLVSLDKAKFVNEELYRRWMKSELRAGDILMTSEAPLGEVYFLPETRRYCLSQRVFSIRSIAALMQPSLLFFFLSSHEGQKQLKSRASGTTVLGIRQADLRRIPVLRPPSTLQRRGDSILMPFLTMIDVLQRNIDVLRRTRDFLLPKLISGEVQVEAADDAAADLMEQTA